jgi:hypothetical protein
MSWEIETSHQVTTRLEHLDDDAFDQIMLSLDELEQVGPALGRPLADRVQGSRHHNMKELRSVGGHLRVLFAFDPRRRAILLIAENKEGQWNQWYRDNIPAADDLYDQHLAGARI